MEPHGKKFETATLDRINAADDLKISAFSADGKTYRRPT